MIINRMSRDELWKLLRDNLQQDMMIATGNENDSNSSDRDSAAPSMQEPITQDPPAIIADKPVSPNVRPDAAAQERLRDIRYYAAWVSEDGANKLRSLRELFLADYPALKAEEDKMHK